MTQEDKDLLLKDLCARLPYGVYMQIADTFKYSIVPAETHLLNVDNCSDILCLRYKGFGKRLKKAISEQIEDIAIMPYLRPMSSMTEEEKHELYNIRPYFINSDGIVSGTQCNTFIQASECQNWLNAHHFDYRGLIPTGLALEAPEGMYMSYSEKHPTTEDIIKKKRWA